MITFKKDNVTFYIQHDPYIWEMLSDKHSDGLGYSEYQYEEKVFKVFKDSEDFDRCDSDIDEFNYDADMFISFLDWFYCQEEFESTEITIVTEHPFWVFHDIMHAEGRDVIGCQGFVNTWVEKDRLISGYNLMKENTDLDLSFEYKEMINEAFKERFKVKEDVFEIEYEYDEDYD